MLCVYVCVASALPNIACLPRPYELRKHSYLLSYPQTPRTHSYLSPLLSRTSHTLARCLPRPHAPRTHCYADVTWNTGCVKNVTGIAHAYDDVCYFDRNVRNFDCTRSLLTLPESFTVSVSRVCMHYITCPIVPPRTWPSRKSVRNTD